MYQLTLSFSFHFISILFFSFYSNILYQIYPRRLRDYLDPRKIFEDRKLHQILKDLTDALEHTTSHSPVTTSFSTSEKGENGITPSLPAQNDSSIQLLNLEFICAPGNMIPLTLFVLICFVLFCSIILYDSLYSSALSCFVLFCFILFYFILFCFVLFTFGLFCSILFCVVLCFLMFCLL